MRTVLVIGIGVGDPGQLTLRAVEALARAEVFLALDKGAGPADLLEARRQILGRHGCGQRLVELPDPARDRSPASYETAVVDWHDERARVVGEALRSELPDGGTAGILVWGDPMLYDSTLRVLERIPDIRVEVVPGITSIQALCAAHGIVLNRIGAPVLITTGRQLAQGWPEGVDDVVVMLDADHTFRHFPEAQIWWGAYVGGEHEVLRRGRVADVAEDIVEVRAAARARLGWVMDVYLLRR